MRKRGRGEEETKGRETRGRGRAREEEGREEGGDEKGHERGGGRQVRSGGAAEEQAVTVWTWVWEDVCLAVSRRALFQRDFAKAVSIERRKEERKKVS